jgi:hypothetical protein
MEIQKAGGEWDRNIDYLGNRERYIQVRTGRKMNRQTDSETVTGNKTERLIDKIISLRKKELLFEIQSPSEKYPYGMFWHQYIYSLDFDTAWPSDHDPEPEVHVQYKKCPQK